MFLPNSTNDDVYVETYNVQRRKGIGFRTKSTADAAKKITKNVVYHCAQFPEGQLYVETYSEVCENCRIWNVGQVMLLASWHKSYGIEK